MTQSGIFRLINVYKRINENKLNLQAMFENQN